MIANDVLIAALCKKQKTKKNNRPCHTYCLLCNTICPNNNTQSFRVKRGMRHMSVTLEVILPSNFQSTVMTYNVTYTKCYVTVTCFCGIRSGHGHCQVSLEYSNYNFNANLLSQYQHLYLQIQLSAAF